MNGIVNNLHILDAQLEPNRSKQVNQGVNVNATQPSFKDVLFSKHANMRLSARNITLSGDQMARVENGIVKANEKGIRDSLVLVDDLALIVNVKSRTVITAMNQNNENVFSNIDGAVIV